MRTILGLPTLRRIVDVVCARLSAAETLWCRARAALIPLAFYAMSAALQAGFFYATNANGTITITGYTGTATEVVVPSSVGGRSVTVLGASSFAENGYLTKVTIPSTVTNIVRSAFYGCDKLTNITVDALNPTYSSLDGVLFNQTADTLIGYPQGRRGAYLVPGSVTNVGDYAFYLCAGLTKIVIGDSVTSLGNSAFAGCTELTDVAIPNSVTNIGDSAFSDCAGLTNVSIDNSVTSIGEQAFAGCTGLASVTIPNSVTNVGRFAFSGSSGLTNVTIGTRVSSIGYGTFKGCTGLTRLAIPSSVTNIEDNFRKWGVFFGPFANCASLTSLSVDPLNPAYSSLDGVLFTKSQDTLVACPEGKSGGYLVPNSVTSIGRGAFGGCTGLTSVAVGSGVTDIGAWAFYGCTRLMSVTLSDSVTDIGESSFSLCSGLTNIALGHGVIRIAARAFFFCDGLTSVTIPSSVTSIEEGAFGSSFSLTSVYFTGKAPGVAQGAFDSTAFIYHLTGTTGWGSSFGGAPTALWLPQVQGGDASFGVRPDGFGFSVSWADGKTVVVEACTNLINPVWSPVGTNSVINGSSYFSDPQKTICPARFYRVVGR